MKMFLINFPDFKFCPCCVNNMYYILYSYTKVQRNVSPQDIHGLLNSKFRGNIYFDPAKQNHHQTYLGTRNPAKESFLSTQHIHRCHAKTKRAPMFNKISERTKYTHIFINLFPLKYNKLGTDKKNFSTSF